VITFCEYAESILLGDSLAAKLVRPPPDLSAAARSARRLNAPVRPAHLTIVPAVRVRVPPVAGMGDVQQRARILHALANHELQAAELFAWAVLAFADTPVAFRRGLVTILSEEQLHLELYLGRLRALGYEFGDFPVTGHFWNRIGDCHSPLEFISMMGLTFENANLDFAGEYARAARRVGDHETAVVLEQVHEDEIRHVAFAWRWLLRWKRPNDDAWTAYVSSLRKPLSPGRARGKEMDRKSRERAGIDAAFIDRLEKEVALRPGGAPR
jgi:uncharacterized ferritin-like protein (DUF455 family)